MKGLVPSHTSSPGIPQQAHPEPDPSRQAQPRSRFVLRYRLRDIPLRCGETFVGRSADCEISVNDQLLSRRHARLIVTGEALTLEDLESANGTYVNGKRVQGSVDLQVGDAIRMGHEEFSIGEITQRRGSPGGYSITADTLDGEASITLVEAVPSTDRISSSSRPAYQSSVDLLSPPTGETPSGVRSSGAVPSPPPPHPSAAPSPVARIRSQQAPPGAASSRPGASSRPPNTLPVAAVNAALAIGAVDDAERLISGELMGIRERVSSGRRVAADVAEQAALCAVKLALATHKALWVDYVISLYALMERPLPVRVIDELYVVLRTVRSIDLAALRAYVLGLDRAATSPAERFLAQQIAGLENRVTNKEPPSSR